MRTMTKEPRQGNVRKGLIEHGARVWRSKARAAGRNSAQACDPLRVWMCGAQRRGGQEAGMGCRNRLNGLWVL